MDMFTLHIEHAVLLGLFTVLTFINCRLHDGAKGAYWFPAYTLSAFTGAVFVALRGYGISDAVSIFFGVTFFHLAYLFLQRGLDEFFEREKYLRWPTVAQLGAVIVSVAGVFQFAVVHPDTQHRLVFYSVMFAFQTGLIATMLFRNARGHLVVPGMLMGGMIGLLSVTNLLRAYLTMREGVPANYMQSGLSQQMSLLVTSVIQGGITVGFVWMTAACLHNELDTLASTDSLTGLLNRRAVELAAAREIAWSRANGNPLSAILIDLDRFKQLNDTFGHAFGDAALRDVARCLQGCMRQADLLARIGGDEFAVLLHNTDGAEAMEIAERLRSSLEQLVLTYGDVEAHVSASFGLAQADGTTEVWGDLVLKCDKAVYEVKSVGGNLAVAQRMTAMPKS